MMNIGKNEGFADILSISWSCWYPKNGKPCGKCGMCSYRVS